MNRANVKHEISSYLHNRGISLLGVAAVRQLPSKLKSSAANALKDAKSIICYGVQIPKGLIYVQNNSLNLYWRYCNIQYRELDLVSNKLCRFLEEENGSATPIYSCFPWKVVNREFWGHLPLVYLAEEAGLGQLAKCGLLVTVQYGTRILLGGVVTSREFKPDEKLDEKLCPSNCFACIDACPVNAVKRTGKVNHDLCIRHSTANPLLALVVDHESPGMDRSFEILLNTIAVDDHSVYSCMECLKACPLNHK